MGDVFHGLTELGGMIDYVGRVGAKSSPFVCRFKLWSTLSKANPI